jgi:peptide/nickel transport system ATP-binding protein
MTPILDVYNLKKYFPVRSASLNFAPAQVRAVDDVSLSIGAGEALSLVGESGCGKSTLGRLVLRLAQPTSGQVWLDGWRIDNMPTPQVRTLRRHVQAVFQDPMSSLSPRMRVRDIVAEPLVNFKIVQGRRQVDERVAELLEKVAMPADSMHKFAHEFSGGQRQRIGIARALASSPKLIVCDEAVAALDVSIKAQVVNLLSDLQAQLDLALLFISHDLAIVKHLSDRVAVMYLGVLVEIADRDSLFAHPAHPYTKALLDSAPASDPGLRGRAVALRGEPPSAMDIPDGCRFHTRCPYVFDRCRTETPQLRAFGPSQMAACHLDALPTRI